MNRNQIVIIILLLLILAGGVLFFIFAPKNKILPPEIVEETVYVNNNKPSKSNNVKITPINNDIIDNKTVPDPEEVKENSDYMNFENTIDRLIEVTNSSVTHG